MTLFKLTFIFTRVFKSYQNSNFKQNIWRLKISKNWSRCPNDWKFYLIYMKSWFKIKHCFLVLFSVYWKIWRQCLLNKRWEVSDNRSLVPNTFIWKGFYWNFCCVFKLSYYQYRKCFLIQIFTIDSPMRTKSV